MIIAIKLAFAIASILGIMLFLYNSKWQIRADCLPVIACAGIVSVTFLSACLSISGLIVTLLEIFGCVYALYSLYLMTKGKLNIREFLCPSIIFFTITAALCVVFLRNDTFYVPDVYSHWGRVVKEMLSFDGFATSESVIDSSKDYPVGAAIFIYYLLRNTGYSNGLAIVSQGILAMALISSFFIGASYKKPLNLLVRMALISISMGGFIYTVHDLMVDYLVALSGAALLIIICTVWRTKENQTFKNLLVLMPVLLLPWLLKSCGVIFWILGEFMIFLLWKQNNLSAKIRIKDALKSKCVWLFCAPIGVYYLWKSYVDHAWFSAGYSTAKFAISLDKIVSIYGQKSFEMRHEIIAGTFYNMLTHNNNRYFYVALALMILMILLCKDNKKYLIGTCLSGFGAWVLYNIGYIAMMLFLMPTREVEWSTALAYERYIGVIAMAIAIWWFWIFTCEGLNIAKSHCNKLSQVSILAVTGVAVLCLAPVYNETILKNSFDPGLIQQYDQIENVAASIAGLYTRSDNLLVYSGEYEDDSSCFNNNTYGAIFLTNNTDCFCNTKIEGGDLFSIEGKIPYFMSRNDYLVVTSKNEHMKELLLSQGISIDDADGIFYRIEKDNTDNTISLTKIK